MYNFISNDQILGPHVHTYDKWWRQSSFAIRARNVVLCSTSYNKPYGNVVHLFLCDLQEKPWNTGRMKVCCRQFTVKVHIPKEIQQEVNFHSNVILINSLIWSSGFTECWTSTHSGRSLSTRHKDESPQLQVILPTSGLDLTPSHQRDF